MIAYNADQRARCARERHEIATALHDELCQPLAALNLRLTMQQRVAAGDGKPLAELAALAETAERAARSLMYRISPPVLFDMGLRPALEWLAEEMQRSYGLSVKVSGDAPGRSLSIDATVLSVLFRCVRELLVNVPRLVSAYYTLKPDVADPAQQVAFGTSGHRGSSLDRAFNDAHIAATTQAICEHRAAAGIRGPLFLGRDTHGLSEPAWRTAVEVLP